MLCRRTPPARLVLEQQKAGCEQQLAQAQAELAGLQQQKQTLEGQRPSLRVQFSRSKVASRRLIPKPPAWPKA